MPNETDARPDVAPDAPLFPNQATLNRWLLSGTPARFRTVSSASLFSWRANKESIFRPVALCSQTTQKRRYGADGKRLRGTAVLTDMALAGTDDFRPVTRSRLWWLAPDHSSRW